MSKKTYFFIFIILFIFGSLFILQIKKTAGIVVHTTNTPLISTQAINIPLDSNDVAFGNPGAPLTIVEFNTIGCKKCSELNSILTNFVSKNPDKVRLYWKSVPNSGIIFGGNFLAHQAAYCAGQQNNFWPFINLALQNNDSLTEDGLKKIAGKLKLNNDAWWKCVTSEETLNKIKEEKKLATQLNINYAPTLFINNKQINIAENIDINEVLQKIIAE